MICYDYAQPLYWIFSSDLPLLLYYSHITVLVLTVVVGFIILLKGKDFLLNKVLFFLFASFALWIFINLITWGSNDSTLTMSVWPFFGVAKSFISISAIYLAYVILYKKDLSFLNKLLLVTATLPTIILAPTNLVVRGFDIAACDAFKYENQGMVFYSTILGTVAIFLIFFMGVKCYKMSDVAFRRQMTLFIIGIEVFLITFVYLSYAASVLTTIGFFEDSSLEFYAVFGMGFFIVTIGILSVKFRTFHFITGAANALVFALVILVSSQFTFVTSTTGRVLIGITLILTCLVGIILLRSLKKEIKQREQIEGLVVDLDKANERLKVLDKMKSEFVSIASHQLRSPLTSIRGYASMLTEGSFGKLPTKAQEVSEKIAESAKYMALSVEDFLSVSRIEAGNMKYEMSDFSLKDVASKVVDEMLPIALKKGLLMVFRSDCSGSCAVHADIGKTRQILMNLIDNSMKYTPKGTITVIAHDDVKKKMMYVTIHDTGIGMSIETQSEVFDKFIRAKNANNVNVTGTGLGLYVAKKMITDMKGRVWAESEGEGKGSQFHIELPMLPGIPTGK